MNAIEELLRATDPAAGAAPTPEPLQDERIAQILARDPALPVTPAPSDGRRNRSYLLTIAGRNGIGIGLAGVEPAPPRYTPVDLLIDPASGEVLGVTYGYVPTEVDFGVVMTRSVLDELPADVISMACSTARNAEPGEPFICPEG